MSRSFLLIAFAIGIQTLQVACAENNSTGGLETQQIHDSIWLVSSRHLPSTCAGLSDPDALQFTRLDCDGQCTRSNFAEYQADGVGRQTCIYVHGNRVSASYAIRRGLRVYRKLKLRHSDTEPMRYVVWSWPASQVKGLVRDARAKAARTDPESFFLASLLQHQPSDDRLSLIGFSFGAPIITGALHLLAGGSVSGVALALDSPHVLNAEVVLMAAAMGNGGLLPRGRYGLAMQQIKKLLLLYNSRDRALKRYWVISRRRHANALGYTGFCGWRFGDLRHRIQQRDVGGCVGKEHSASLYINNNFITRLMADGVFGGK